MSDTSPRPLSLPGSIVATLALTILVSTVAPLAARGEESTSSALRPGAWAAEFEIDPSLSYRFGYTGSATLAMKHHSSAGRALRFGVNFGFSEDEREGTAENSLLYPPNYPTPLYESSTIERHSERHSYSLFLHLVSEKPVRDRVALFGEFGPSFHYSEATYHTEYLRGISPQVRSIQEDSQQERAVALDLSLGFEWFFSGRLSLGARYGAFAAYAWGSSLRRSESRSLDDLEYSIDQERLDTRGVDLGTSRVTVTLAAYF